MTAPENHRQKPHFRVGAMLPAGAHDSLNPEKISGFGYPPAGVSAACGTAAANPGCIYLSEEMDQWPSMSGPNTTAPAYTMPTIKGDNARISSPSRNQPTRPRVISRNPPVFFSPVMTSPLKKQAAAMPQPAGFR